MNVKFGTRRTYVRPLTTIYALKCRGKGKKKKKKIKKMASILPNNQPWDDKTQLSHDAGVKPILNLQGIQISNISLIYMRSISWNVSLILTQIQKKNASSKEFWKRMTWIRISTIWGLWNQKWSSEGLTTNSPSIATCFSATSWANWVITCSSLVPTATRSWNQRRYDDWW